MRKLSSFSLTEMGWLCESTGVKMRGREFCAEACGVLVEFESDSAIVGKKRKKGNEDERYRVRA